MTDVPDRRASCTERVAHWDCGEDLWGFVGCLGLDVEGLLCARVTYAALHAPLMCFGVTVHSTLHVYLIYGVGCGAISSNTMGLIWANTAAHDNLHPEPLVVSM